MSSGSKRSAAATSARSAARTPRSARWSPIWAARACGCRPASPPPPTPIGAIVEANGLKQKIADALAKLAAGKATLPETGAAIRAMFLQGEFPPETGASDPRGLCRAVQARRQGGCRRRGALERHRRGSAGRQLRRPAGDLPEHPRRRGAARRLPALLRLAVHRPRHQLPPRQGLRPHEGRALHRRAAHGALRSRRLRRDVLDRHRDRASTRSC